MFLFGPNSYVIIKRSCGCVWQKNGVIKPNIYVISCLVFVRDFSHRWASSLVILGEK